MPPNKKALKHIRQQSSTSDVAVETQEDNLVKTIFLDQSYFQKADVLEGYKSIKIDFQLLDKQNIDSFQNFINSIAHIQQLEIEFGKSSLCGEEVSSLLIKLVISQLSLTSLSISFFEVKFSKSLCESLSQCFLNQQKLLKLRLILSTDFSSSDGSESIYNSICSLPSIKHLDYFHLEIGKFNSINYQILASAISNMSSLRYLTLKIEKFNKVSPLGAKHLSIALGSLSNIESLDFQLEEFNSIGKDSWKSIIDSFQAFSNLTILKLIIHGNSCGVNEIQSLFSSFSYLIQMKKFDFTYKTKAKLPLSVYTKLKDSLQSLKKLKQLSFELYDSQSDVKESRIAFAKCFSELTWVKELQIKFGENILTDGSSINTFSNSIGGVKGLTHLEIFLNTNKILSLTEFELLGETIGRFKKLNSLEFKLLIINRKKPELSSFETIFSSMQKLTALKEFSIEVCDTTLEGSESLMYLPKVTKKLSKLTKYVIKIGRKNKLDSIGFKYICESADNITNLVNLSLDISDFTESNDSQLFGNVLEKKISLESLSLRLSHLSEQFIFSLSNSFISLQHLTKLDLKLGQEQSITKKSACGLIESIKSLTQLNTLELDIYSDKNYTIYDQIEVLSCFDFLEQLTEFKIQTVGQTQLSTTVQLIEKSIISFSYKGKYLSLSQANDTIQHENFENFWKKLNQLKDISFLQLEYNQNFDLTPLKFYFLSSSAEQLKGLTELNLVINHKYRFQRFFDDEDIQDLSNALLMFSSLRKLIIEIPLFQDISQSVGVNLKKAIQQMLNLEKIKFITGNQKGDLEVFVLIMEGIQYLENLIVVTLQSNGQVILEISLNVINQFNNKNEIQENESRQPNQEDLSKMIVETNSLQNHSYNLSVKCDNQINKESWNKSKWISDIGRIFQLTVKLKSIILEIDQPFEIDRISILQLIKGLKMQQGVEELQLKNSSLNQFDHHQFREIGEAISKQNDLKKLHLDLYSNDSVKVYDLFEVYSFLNKLSQIQNPIIRIRNYAYLLNNDQLANQQAIIINDNLYLQLLSDQIQIQSADFIQIGQGISLLQNIVSIKFRLNLCSFFKNMWKEYHLYNYSKNKLFVLDAEFSLKEDTDLEIEDQSLEYLIEDLKQFTNLKINLKNDSSISRIHQFRLKNSQKLNNLTVLGLSITSGFQLDDNGQENILNWIGSCKHLKNLQFQIDSTSRISCKSLMQFGRDIEKMKNLEVLSLNIRFDDLSTHINTYMEFCNSIFKRNYNSYQIYLGRYICFEILSNGLYSRQNTLSFIKDKKQYGITLNYVIDPQQFAEGLLKYIPSLKSMIFDFWLFNGYSESIQQVYKSCMSILLQQKRKIKNIGIGFGYNDTQQLISLFRNVLTHTQNVNQMKIQYHPDQYRDRRLRFDLKLYIRELQYVTVLQIHEPISNQYITNTSTRTVKLSAMKLKRLVDFKHYKSQNIKTLF